MSEQFTNNASSTLNGSINSITTTIVVTSAAPFPAIPEFRLLLGANATVGEIVYVTGVAGNTFTVQRAQEGTTAQSWSSLSTITHILTAASINAIRSQKHLLVNTFPGQTTTDSTSFVSAGTFEFNQSEIIGSGTRVIKLRVVSETTSPQMTIQLFNLTTASVVAGSTLTTSSTTPVLLVTGDLSANLSAGLATYQVQIKMAAGTVADQITLDMATLRIDWS